jgi:formaldehyde-activating enzyme involved in methanogenesis
MAERVVDGLEVVQVDEEHGESAAPADALEGVLDAVAEGLLAADADTVVLAAVWVDASADDETAVRTASRQAMRRAIGDAVQGPGAGAVERLVRERESLRNPFYGGE